MTTILFPTDFSRNSINAIHYGMKLSAGKLQQIILLNVYDTPVMPLSEQAVMPVNYIAEIIENSKSGLKRIEELIREEYVEANAKIECVSMIGPLKSAVEELSRERNIDLIIMGTHGADGLKSILVGSNAYDVMKSAKCPVLSIPSLARFAPPAKVLFSSDLKPIQNPEGMKQFKRIVNTFKSSVKILNIRDSNTKPTIEDKTLAGFPKDIAHEFLFLENEHIEDGIMEAVEKYHCDLLTMVIHDLSFFKRLFHPAISRKIALKINKPLLTFHG